MKMDDTGEFQIINFHAIEKKSWILLKKTKNFQVTIM